MEILLADKQDITRAGLMYVLSDFNGVTTKYVEDKSELLLALQNDGNRVIVLDYTLFDINDAAELSILSERFAEARWLLFCEDLSVDFVRVLIATSPRFSILLKECSLQEIREALDYAVRGRRFICQRIAEMLLVPMETASNRAKLTPTENEILKDIALGMTTREIAEKRFSSFHTVNTHRKNIFRKLGVNFLCICICGWHLLILFYKSFQMLELFWTQSFLFGNTRVLSLFANVLTINRIDEIIEKAR